MTDRQIDGQTDGWTVRQTKWQLYALPVGGIKIYWADALPFDILTERNCCTLFVKPYLQS